MAKVYGSFVSRICRMSGTVIYDTTGQTRTTRRYKSMADQEASFDEMRELLAGMPGPDEAACEKTRAREAELTKPTGALGRLEVLSEWFATWQGRYPPQLERPRVAVFVANHGVAARDVSAFPATVTAQMVENFQASVSGTHKNDIYGAQMRIMAQILETDKQIKDVGAYIATMNYRPS